MAYIHDPIIVEQGRHMPSLGALIGSRVSDDVYNRVQSNGFKSFFGSDYDTMNTTFFNQYTKPMNDLSLDLSRTVNALLNPDQFRILSTIEDFQSIPPCMELAIALYEPVRKGILEGRMEGFGYDETTLPDEDFYGRMISNFRCEGVQESSDDDGRYLISATIYSDDPDLDDDQLYAIEMTRETIRDRILATTNRDPTCINSPRG